jgi:heme exporter protein A
MKLPQPANKWVTDTARTCLGAPVNFTANDLTCVRGGRLVFQALGFQVAAGSVLVLRGPNGCGKSSLLRLVAGFQAPAAGNFLWDDNSINNDPDGHRARITYAGHLDAVKTAFSVTEGLMFWARIGGMGDPKAVAEALDLWGLGPVANIPSAYLSAGQRKRLNLARLSLSTAQMWLLDEPTVSLDDGAIDTLMTVIGEHQAGGGSAIIATHTDLALNATNTLNLEPFTAFQTDVPAS